MAARKSAGTKTTPWSQKTRDRIKTSMLINRLEQNALGKIDLNPTQVRSIEILLKKSLPDLQSVEHTGGLDHNVTVTGALQWQPPQ